MGTHHAGSIVVNKNEKNKYCLCFGVVAICFFEWLLKMSVRVLILPKFEVEELSGDFPGEAQYFFEEYLSGGDVYDIDGCPEETKLYYKNGVAMCVVGQDQGGRKRSPRGKIPWEIDHA